MDGAMCECAKRATSLPPPNNTEIDQDAHDNARAGVEGAERKWPIDVETVQGDKPTTQSTSLYTSLGSIDEDAIMLLAYRDVDLNKVKEADESKPLRYNKFWRENTSSGIKWRCIMGLT